MIYSKHAEMSIVGAIMYDGVRAVDMAIGDKITPDHFYSPKCKEAYIHAIELFKTGKVCDISTMLSDLGAGEEEFLTSCLDTFSTIASMPEWCSVLHDNYQRREIKKLCSEITGSLGDTDVDIEELRSKVELGISGLSRKKAQFKDVHTILDSAIEDWYRARDNGRCIGVQTGFIALDRFFGGLMKSAFYIFSGPPGSCKTTLARNIMEHVADSGMRVSMLSLEQTSEQIWAGIIARYAKQSVFLLNCGSKRANIEAIKDTKEFVSKLPIHVEERPHSISDAMSWGRREVAAGSQLLVVDYIQRLQGDKGVRYGTKEDKVAQSSTALADLAKETGIPVLAISALSRTGNLRGSGVLDYDAYCMLNLAKSEQWSPDNLSYTASFNKQRFGPPAEAQTMYLLGDEGRLVDESVYNAISDEHIV